MPDVSIIGAGRVGAAFARRLVQAGMSVDGPLPRGAMPAAPIVILAVPDRAIEEVARRVPAGLLVGHCAASVPLAAGIFEMPYWRFQIANFVSALVWSAALLLFGDVIAMIAEWLWRVV